MVTLLIPMFICLKILCCEALKSVQVSQERAVVASYDPAYVENPQAFTFRIRRRMAYTSNLTLTTLHPWGNNVTIALSYKGNSYGTDVYIKGKICDALNVKWIKAFFTKHMNIVLTCPFPPGSYGVYNLELPPKDFPFPLPKGEGVIHTKFLKDGKRIIYHSYIKVNIV